MSDRTFTKEEIEQNRRDWVAALRSGQFKKCTGALEKPRIGNCCIGVAYRLFDRKYPGVLNIKLCGKKVLFDGEQASANELIQNAFGLSTALGESEYGAALTELNDAGKSFAEIADIIESRPPGLFIKGSEIAVNP